MCSMRINAYYVNMYRDLGCHANFNGVNRDLQQKVTAEYY